ncbi:TolC family protein [Paenimyroides tangerinum]|uniref:TolC family protein n=1 Tax=Paenimyroides tangerinum TaxID=2488728 RepID=A0A3P3WDQ0_9FLAO|nr:TolC family protein [Paenimyroides tangerinum]RRJ93285.1 TolC family protein [Paenimyroides tangerinum]
MKRSFWNIAMLFLVSTTATFAQHKLWTLQECISHARENNIFVQKSELQYQNALINKSDAIGNFLPSANVSSSHSWNIGLNQNITTGLLENQTTQFTSAGLDVGIDIYKGSQNLYKLQRSRLTELSAKYQQDKLQDDISINVVNSYLQILFNREFLKVYQSQYKYDASQYDRIKILVEAGNVPAGDLLDSEATLATTLQNMTIAENNLKISKLALAQLLQITDYEHFDVIEENIVAEDSSVLLESPETIVAKSKDVLLDSKINEAELEIAKKDIQIARASYLPTIRGFYSFQTRAAYSKIVNGMELNQANPTSTIGYVEGTNQSVLTPNYSPVLGPAKGIFDQFDTNKGQNFGIGISIPILNGFQIRNNVSRSKIALETAELNLKETNLQIEQKVYTAYSDTQGALQTYKAAQKTLTARKQSLEYARQRYDVGLLNIFDLNQNQNLVIAAESELLRTKYDFIFKTKILEYYFGLPIFKNEN